MPRLQTYLFFFSVSQDAFAKASLMLLVNQGKKLLKGQVKHPPD